MAQEIFAPSGERKRILNYRVFNHPFKLFDRKKPELTQAKLL